MSVAAAPGVARRNAAAAQVVDYDRQYVLKHCAIKGAQAFALLAPPVILARALWRRSFSPRRALRSLAFNTFILGPPLGYAAGWLRMRNMADEGIGDRAFRLRNNVGQIKVDDAALTGSVLGALLTTAIFLKRLPLWLSVSSGAALGIDGAIIYHLSTFTGAGGPNAMIEELKAAYPLKQDVEQVAAGEGDKVIKGQ